MEPLFLISTEQDPQFFVRAHGKIGEGPATNCTTLRLLHYPAVTEVKETQLRCGEHTDYGSITLLFQDENGGLEVVSRACVLMIHVFVHFVSDCCCGPLLVKKILSGCISICI